MGRLEKISMMADRRGDSYGKGWEEGGWTGQEDLRGATTKVLRGNASVRENFCGVMCLPAGWVVASDDGWANKADALRAVECSDKEKEMSIQQRARKARY